MITPDNFKGRPLEWAGNQCGHMFMCAAAAFALSMAWFYFFDEYPIKWCLFAVIAAGYLAIELPQGGGFWDTLEDVLFVIGYGSVFFLFPFSEIEEGNLMLQFNPHNAIIPSVFVSIHLSLGMGIRLFQMRQFNELG